MFLLHGALPRDSAIGSSRVLVGKVPLMTSLTDGLLPLPALKAEESTPRRRHRGKGPAGDVVDEQDDPNLFGPPDVIANAECEGE